MVGTVVCLLLALIPGWLALRCIGPERRSSLFETLSLAYGLGIGAVAITLFLLSLVSSVWAGPRLSRGLILFVVLSIVAVLFVLWRRVRRQSSAPGSAGPPGAGLSLFGVLLVAVLVLLFLSQAYYAANTPLSAMDAMGFWGYSAKAIFFDGTVRTPAVVEPLRGHPHPRYPLLVPLAQDWVHFLRGRYDDSAVKLVFVGFYVALVGVVFGAARRRWGRIAEVAESKRSQKRRGRRIEEVGDLPTYPRAGMVAAFLVATIPVLRADGFGAAFALADIPLAFFIAAALVSWLRWMDEGQMGDLVLTFVFAALGAWTKNEGLVALILLTVLVVAEAVSRRRRVGAVVGAVAVGWVLVVPWLLFQGGLAAVDENYPAHVRLSVFIANAGRLPAIGGAWLRELVDASRWSILWLLAAVAGVWAVRRRLRPACWVGAFALGQVLVYTVVYVVAPWDIAELLELTATRLLLHVMPAAVLLCVLVVPKAWHAQSLPSRPPD